MIPALEHIRREARLLSPDAREALLSVLEHDLQDVNEGDAAEEIAAAWNEEISRRVKQVESGEAELIAHEQVMAEMRAHLEAKRLPA